MFLTPQSTSFCGPSKTTYPKPCGDGETAATSRLLLACDRFIKNGQGSPVPPPRQDRVQRLQFEARTRPSGVAGRGAQPRGEQGCPPDYVLFDLREKPGQEFVRGRAEDHLVPERRPQIRSP